MRSVMKPPKTIPRREFLKMSIVSGAVLGLGFTYLEGDKIGIVKLPATDSSGTVLNPYILIDSDGKITLFNHRPEMGQGTFQSIPMILAEELAVTLEKVNIVPAPADREKYGSQMVVGSSSIRGQFVPLRKIGAAAREMLVQAAANRWKADISDCYAEDAMVIHRTSGQKASYGELVADASKLTPPENPGLKEPKDFTIIGTASPRRDNGPKVNGQAMFGIDMQVPGMLYASVERSAVFLGKIVSFNAEKTKAVPGVIEVLKTQRNVWGHTREGVAVIATSYWAAEQGRKALKITWDNGDLEQFSSGKIKADYKNAAAADGVVFKEDGNFSNAFNNAPIKVEASYETPYQSHACMEPMNAMVSVSDNHCEFWGSTQNPNGVRSQLASQLDIPEENVIVHYTFMGGGLGRRSMTDVAEEAADLSKKMGKPIKVIWSREDDITQGPFRACSLNLCQAGIDSKGNISAISHKVICQDIRNQTGDNAEAGSHIAGGIITDYAVPNFHLSGVLQKFYIPITYWRAVYHSTNCFAHESFIDEIARAAKKDPLNLRLSLLKNHRRFTNVLKMVAEKSSWFTPREKNTGKGVAIVERSGSFIAMVIEVARINESIKVVKITAAVDCGIVVNPDIAKAQTEGSAIMGLTAAYKSQISIEAGKVSEKNFDTYKMVMLHECPEIDVTLIKSEDPPEGVGEAGLPTVAPALANAIFEMTGKRIRSLPLSLDKV